MSSDSEIGMTPEARRALDEALSKISFDLKSKAEKIARARSVDAVSEQDLVQAISTYRIAIKQSTNPSPARVKVKGHQRKFASGKVVYVRSHMRRTNSTSMASGASLVATLVALTMIILQIAYDNFNNNTLITIGGIIVAAATAITLTMLLNIRKQATEGIKKANYRRLRLEFISSWTDIEKRVRETVAEAMGEELGKEPFSSIYSKYLDITEASEEDRSTLKELQHLRNAVVHGVSGVSEADLSGATVRAKSLLRRMKKFTQL